MAYPYRKHIYIVYAKKAGLHYFVYEVPTLRRITPHPKPMVVKMEVKTDLQSHGLGIKNDHMSKIKRHSEESRLRSSVVQNLF